MSKYISLLLSLVFLVLSPYANANIVGADTQNFNPDYGHSDFVTVKSSKTTPKAHLNTSFFIDYSSESLPVYPDELSPGVVNKQDIGDTAVYTHLGFGLGLTDWLDIGASFPYIVSQDVDSPQPRGQFADNGAVEMRFAAKARLVNFEGNGGFAVLGSVGINRVDFNPFIGDDPGPTINIEAIADKQFGKLHLSGNIGYRLRDPGLSNKDVGGVPIQPNDDILIASVGAAYAIDEKLGLMGELWGAWPDGDFGGVAIYRDVESYEALLGLKYKYSEKLNFHGGLTTGINKGLSTPAYRAYGGLNWMFGPLWSVNKTKRVKKAKMIADNESFYNPGFRQGYMAGYGIGPYANMGADHGQSLDGGPDYPEGFYDGYVAAGSPFPEKVIAKTPYSKCYRTGFQGKLGNGPAEGQGLGYGSILGLGLDCSEGYDQGYNDAPDPTEGKESYYNPGYREGYKAGFGIGPYAGLGADHGENLDGGWEFPEGFRDGYNDVIGPFPGSDDTRIYGKGYRFGFQGKLGKGPGKGTGPNFGASINPTEPFPLGFEHGWIDAPDMKPDPVVLDANDGNVFDGLEAKKEESFRLENVLFDTASYKLRKVTFPVLDSLARHLQKGEGFRRLIVEGHTDSDGEATYNERLSLQRAMSVEKYLTDVHGLDGDKIIADGWGERKPVAPNNSRANKQKNRRVEFKISR
ncbi:MAG: OmpA family protein [Bdellovibrionales bacterium]